MPFDGHTPEALLGRSDSKNPATTCRGLTTAGRPCRRTVVSATKDLSEKICIEPGVIAAARYDRRQLSSPAYFCWQHKDQVVFPEPARTSKHHVQRKLVTVTQRTSIDSLVERLGLTQLDARGARESLTPSLCSATAEPKPRTRGAEREKSTSHERSAKRRSKHQHGRGRHSAAHHGGFWAALCCFGGSGRDDEYYEIVRHRQRSKDRQENGQRGKPQPLRQQPMQQVVEQQNKHKDSTSYQPAAPSNVVRKPLPHYRMAPVDLPRKLTPQAPIGITAEHLLALIPKQLSGDTVASLLRELSKPISPHDEEGYIYIFWLTDSSTKPDEKTAASLLSHRANSCAEIQNLARMHSVSHRTSSRNQRILLKIGRASNVHRRMTEWTQQCGHALSLVRFYPHVSRSPPTTPKRATHAASFKHADGLGQHLQASKTPNQILKVPHVHRVERLIHLELASSRVKRGCEACGKEHREWFEVEPTEKGIRNVDETVRRWVTWAQDHVV